MATLSDKSAGLLETFVHRSGAITSFVDSVVLTDDFPAPYTACLPESTTTTTAMQYLIPAQLGRLDVWQSLTQHRSESRSYF